MASDKFTANNQSQMAETTLDLLSALDEKNSVSQRSLSTRLGIALGLTNSLLKRCIKKGLLKVIQAPARRYAYYLTPRGFNEKSRLTAEYLSHSLGFFRRSRTQYSDALEYCEAREWKNIALYGVSELAEIAILASFEHNTNIVAIIDEGRNASTFCNVPVVRSIIDLKDVDCVIITCIEKPQKAFETLLQLLPEEHILTPQLLHVSRNSLKTNSPVKKEIAS